MTLRPQDIVDTFWQSVSFDQEVRMPWKESGAVESRMEAVIRRGEGERVSALSREYGVSRQTIYKWIRRYKKEGACGLFDRSRRPRRSPNQISPELEQRIIELRQEYGWGGRNLRDLLAREGIEVSAATVDRVITRNGLIRESDKQRPATRRFQREKPNHLWQMDFKGEYRLPGGTCWPLSIIDDCSRLHALTAVPDARRKRPACGGGACLSSGTTP